MKSLATVLAAVVGAASESLHHQGGEPRQNGGAATWTAAGVLVNDETPRAWQPGASLRREPHLDTTERGLAL